MRMHKGLLAALLLGSLVSLSFPAGLEGSFSVSLSFFHQQLAPHGRWVVSASLGEVWVPSRISVTWAPYTDGEWTLTDYGWTWVSYDPWGNIPCHYGTWAWMDPYGWVWAPGTVWAPAWVTWAYTDDFIGWAPLPPTFALSASGYAGAPVVVPATRYVFVPTNQFVGVRISSARVGPAQAVAILPRASKVTNFQVSSGIVRMAGPSSARVEKAVGRRIEPVHADAIKIRPTTLAVGGFEKASRVPVILSPAERGRAAAPTSQPHEKPPAEKALHHPVESGKRRQPAAPAQTRREESTASQPHKSPPGNPHQEMKPHAPSGQPPVVSRSEQSPGHARPQHEPKKAKAPSKEPKPAHEQQPG